MKPLSIAFFGSSLVSAYWNGAATYYRGILQALAARGHRITFYEPDAFDRQAHRDIPDPSWARVVVYPINGTGGVQRALDDAHRSDLIVKASGVGAFDSLLEAQVPAIKRPAALAVFWDVDAPATLDRIAANPNDPFGPLIPAYDMVLTYGGGPPVVAGYQRLGAQVCVPIYNGLDPATHHPARPDPRFACDLGLIANRLPDRERRIDEFFLAVAADLPRHKFVLGGNGWSDKGLPPNVSYVGHVYTRDHNAFNVSARAVLNVSRDSMAAYGYSPATRVFEAAGTGSCIITDAWEGIGEFFEPGREILVAPNGPAVVDILTCLTAQEARRIGEAARGRALAEHSYERRVDVLELALKGRLA
ncbi:MAG: glycosyltransferase [Alphaproteobacteria bacterium]|nr:glycosyltransferase [Alphaproteobacteria bacterium]